MKKRTVIGVVLAHSDIDVGVLRQVTRNDRFPAMGDTFTHIPHIGVIGGNLIQAVACGNKVYTLTKGTPSMKMIMGHTFGEPTLTPVVTDIWTRMLDHLRDDTHGADTPTDEYTHRVYPGRGLYQDVTVSIHSLDLGDYTLKIHYISDILEVRPKTIGSYTV